MDPIATRTLLTLIGLFAGAFAVTLFFDLLGRKRGRITGIGNLWLRYLSWAVIAPVFLAMAYCGNPVFYVFGAVLVMLYLEEFYAITRVKQVGVYKWEGRIFAAITLWAAALADKTLFYCLPILVITVVVTTPIIARKTEDAARLGREAAYTGQVKEWNKFLNDPLDTMPKNLAFGPLPEAVSHAGDAAAPAHLRDGRKHLCASHLLRARGDRGRDDGLYYDVLSSDGGSDQPPRRRASGDAEWRVARDQRGGSGGAGAHPRDHGRAR